MSILAVGSVALDSVETPGGGVTDAIGGSAVFFSAAASLFTPVRLVGIVGRDYPVEELHFLAERGVDLSTLEEAEGASFRWSGVYSDDFVRRDTLHTELGVFADFHPRIPARLRDARHIFLGNTDPALQLEVLEQLNAPGLVACDTMNFWIEGSRETLLRVLERVDILIVNDAEARQLADDRNLLKAARWIRERGPKVVVVKKGEHGAMLLGPEGIFLAPGYPLEDVFDPTGAGDSFAGGFFGFLAMEGSLRPGSLHRAMIYGSVLGSFAVEDFGVGRLRRLDRSEVAGRFRDFHAMTAFEPHHSSLSHA